MRNLFIQLHECRVGDEEDRFGLGWEDLFTEQLAFYLSCDRAAANALARTLLEDDAVEVEDVELQPSTADGTPDLALVLRDAKTLFLEHKVEASLQPRQLSRYLSHGTVALVSRRSLTVPEAALEHEDYVCPPRREHWAWEDVFRALPLPEDPPPTNGALREAFRSYMRELCLAPSDLSRKWRRLFEDQTKEENRRIQREFGRRLDGLKRVLRNTYGLRVQNVSHKGKQAYAPEDAPWKHLYVYPARLQSEIVPRAAREAFEPGYEALAVEVVYDEERSQAARQLLDRLPNSFEAPAGRRWNRIGISPINRGRLRLTVATPLAAFFKEESGLEEPLHAAATGAVEVMLEELGLPGNAR